MGEKLSRPSNSPETLPIASFSASISRSACTRRTRPSARYGKPSKPRSHSTFAARARSAPSARISRSNWPLLPASPMRPATALRKPPTIAVTSDSRNSPSSIAIVPANSKGPSGSSSIPVNSAIVLRSGPLPPTPSRVPEKSGSVLISPWARKASPPN